MKITYTTPRDVTSPARRSDLIAISRSPALVVLAAGERGMLWASVLEAGRPLYAGVRPVSWMGQTGSCRIWRASQEVVP